ncbi:hypothetical protein AAFF_G00075450 [Aldrovandia affinis]|uniref:Uncharacterized protein n=1 Tax=Aldrovandia affinis TaxID=143900 RepID=A0AAD7RYA9_9TELE|nr:hypothetical protein AAFF_G00075450 [Aldrovandia affinis]
MSGVRSEEHAVLRFSSRCLDERSRGAAGSRATAAQTAGSATQHAKEVKYPLERNKRGDEVLPHGEYRCHGGVEMEDARGTPPPLLSPMVTVTVLSVGFVWPAVGSQCRSRLSRRGCVVKGIVGKVRLLWGRSCSTDLSTRREAPEILTW